MYRRLLSLLFLLLLNVAAPAQYGSTSQPGVKLRSRSFPDLYAAQKVLISNYCRLDFEGARLQAAGWNRFRPFTSLRANPEFSRVIVVTRFDIETPQQPVDSLSANYQMVGFYQEGEGYMAFSSSDLVTFRVQEQNGNLVVTEVSSQVPHVSPHSALAWIQFRLSDSKTSELERAHLKNAVTQLDKLLLHPQPPQ